MESGVVAAIVVGRARILLQNGVSAVGAGNTGVSTAVVSERVRKYFEYSKFVIKYFSIPEQR